MLQKTLTEYVEKENTFEHIPIAMAENAFLATCPPRPRAKVGVSITITRSRPFGFVIRAATR
jgi:hypothetical protein